MNDSVTAFLRVLDPADNSTGGGSASAIAGAMAASLTAMVARLSVGRAKMEAEAFYTEVAAEGTKLSEELLSGAQEDAAAFDAVVAAHRLSRMTEAEKGARDRAIQQATAQAALVPLANGRRSRSALQLCEKLRGRSNPNAASDLECAEHLARAAILGCAANVTINLPGIKDSGLRVDLEAGVRALRNAGARPDKARG